MHFTLYRRSDMQILAVPAIFTPAEFIEQQPELEILGNVRIDPMTVSAEVIAAVGLQGYAELQGADVAQFLEALATPPAV